MMRLPKALAVFLLLISFVIVTSCSTSIALTYRDSVPGEATGVKIQRAPSKDLRDPDRGGGDPVRIGTLRNGYGMPSPWNTTNESVMGLFDDMLDDAIAEAGYTNNASGAPIVMIEVIDFWCDGYIGQKLTFVIDVKLLDADGNKVLAKERIEYDSAFVIAVSIKEAETYYKNGLSEMLDKLVVLLKSPKFRTYLK